MARTLSAMAARRSIPTRRISFEPDLARIPKHFAGDGDLLASHVIAMASALFPDGEDFFVRSVRAFRDCVDDPALKTEVAGFIGQEATHGREHRSLNVRLQELGYPTERVERFTRDGLAAREHYLPPLSNLAATAALEHYTATFAEILLSDAEAQRQMGDSPVLDILLWHALEESEHKAVAFDVYKAAGGSHRTRTIAMNMVTIGFLGSLAVQTVRSVLDDRASWTREDLVRSYRRAKSSRFFRREVWRRLRDFNRPDFHPNDHDTTELLEHWRTELFGPDGRFNHHLKVSEARHERSHAVDELEPSQASWRSA
jgi:predicted metal-dependent hydrolase